MQATPVFLDFEASSLASASYPIEVAWSCGDDSIESHLISPASVARWTDWHAKAEALHGLSREQLIEKGKPPVWVAQRMNEQLVGQTLYSDNPDFDGFWLEELFRASAGLKPAFQLLHVDELLMSLVAIDSSDVVRKRDAIETLKQTARSQMSGQHRAALDVQYLLRLYALARESV